MKLLNRILSKFNLNMPYSSSFTNLSDSFLKKIRCNKSLAFFFHQNGKYYTNLASIGFTFYLDEINNSIVAQFSNIKIYVQSYEELFILNEIFYEGIYSYHLSSKHVMLDIGMNVGFASLYFAAFALSDVILSYEPVPNTYAQGIRNLNLNPCLKSKIKAYNYGLGSRSRNEMFIYSSKWKGSVGIRGLDPNKAKDSEEAVKVDLYDISDTISTAKSYDLPIAAKIDCEGSEYEIIERLNYLNEINSVDLYMIEWHDIGPKRILDILHQNNFSTICSNPYCKYGVGMIYAFNKNPKMQE